MKRDQLIVGVLIATWPIAGLIEPFTPSYGQIYNEASLGHALVLAILLFAWCKAHASERGVPAPTGAPLLVALLAPVGLPYYFFRSFTWRRASVGLAKALLVFMGCCVLYVGGMYVGSRLAA
ncbi:hypothetical protein AB4Y64_17715 [Lysobacter sp. TAF61]|uniref:hypothetical protein n=1 Tax=Lysobacter sp. TAF61 TaxID=3233072 RepID=UPI003F9A3F5E